MSGVMPNRLENGAGFLVNNGKPKLDFHGPLDRDSTGIINMDDKGDALFDNSGKPKLVRQFFFVDDSVPIPNIEENGAGFFDSNGRPKPAEKLQFELTRPEEETNLERTGRPIMAESGAGSLNL